MEAVGVANLKCVYIVEYIYDVPTVAVNEPRLKVAGGISVGRNGIVVKSGLCHSRELDPNTRQVNVTWSSGHVNCLSLFEVSSTFSSDREQVTHW